MNQDQFGGLVRNLLIPLGAFMAAHGIAAGTWDGLSGMILAAAMFGWAGFTHEETPALLLSLVRGAIGAIGGYMVQRGWASSDQITTWTGIAAAIVPSIWTWFANRFPDYVASSKKASLAFLAVLLSPVALKLAIVAGAIGLAGCMPTTGNAPTGAATPTPSFATLVAGDVKIAAADIKAVAKALPNFCGAAAVGVGMTNAELALVESLTKLPAKTVGNISNALGKGRLACTGTAIVLTPLAGQ